MKRIIANTIIGILIIIMFLTNGCATSESKIAYYKLQEKAIEAQSKNTNDLLKLELYEDGKIKSISMGNPYNKPIEIKEAENPGYRLISDIVRSPVVSIIGGGFAASMLMKEAGDHISGSYNSGSNNSSQGGHISVATESASSSLDASAHDDHSVNDSFNDSSQTDNSNTNITNTTDSNNPIDNSVSNSNNHDEAWSDSHDDNSQWSTDDHRSNYENQQDTNTTTNSTSEIINP